MNGTHDRPDAPSPQPATPPTTPTPPPLSPPPVAQPAVQPRDPRVKSPALACILSAMPGLGQVYVGYYARGFVHALVIFSLITLLASEELDALTPLAALFLAFFWLYNIVDAGRRATFYNQLLAGQEGERLPPEFETPKLGGSIFGGVALIVIGLILLTHTLWDFSLRWIEDWWPVAPIVLGVFLVVRAIQDRAD